MFPFLDFIWKGEPHSIHARLPLVIFLLLACIIYSVRGESRNQSIKISVFILCTYFIGVLGARFFHLWWEAPPPTAERATVWSGGNGNTLYGGIVAALAFYATVGRFFFEKSKRGVLLARFAVVTVFGIGVLRIGCFLEGCCWGSLCDLPWAVTYTNERSFMADLGLPVHPVQLYEAALCFVLAVFLHRRRARGAWLVAELCLGYGVIRFFTEFFRGDDYRGVNLALGLSTSQWVSIIFVFIAGALLVREKIRTSARPVDL